MGMVLVPSDRVFKVQLDFFRFHLVDKNKEDKMAEFFKKQKRLRKGEVSITKVNEGKIKINKKEI